MKKIVLFSLTLLLIGGFLLAQNLSLAPKALAQDQPESPIKMSDFTPIDGANVFRAEVFEEVAGDSGILSSVKREVYGKPALLHNYIFTSATDSTSQMLIPHNNTVISETLPVFESGQTQADSSDGGNVKYFWYTLIPADTNNDSKLGDGDRRTLAVSDADGKNFTEVIKGVDELKGQFQKNASTRLVFYTSNGKTYKAIVDLAKKQATLTASLPDVAHPTL